MNSPDPKDCQQEPARRRRAPWAVGITALALIASAVIAPAAMADDIGPYHIDGVVPDDTDPDLTPVTDPAGNAQELGPLNNASTKIGVIHNDAVPTLGTTNPNAQVDLNTAWLDTTRVAGANNTFTDFLYFAWARDKDTGSGFIAYEFMKNAAPAACAYDTATDAQLIANCNPWANRDGDSDGNGPDTGDFLILWDQQGGSTELLVRKWIGTAPNLTLGPASALSNYDAQYSPDNFRGEAAINLTANGLGSGGACNAFANVIPSTVTGNSDTADYKDTILKKIPLSNCESTTVTTPQAGTVDIVPANGVSIGGGVVQVRDKAVVSLTGGTATPAGSVAFWLCKVDTGTCSGVNDPNVPNVDRVGLSVGSTNLTGSAYPVTVFSPNAFVTAAGRYCWRATFSGDSNNQIPGSTDSTTGECFTVNPVTPSLSTTASGTIFLGGTVSDSATISGLATQPRTPPMSLSNTAGAAAGGTITFKLYGPNNCTTLAYTSAAVTVSGNGTYGTPNPQFTPTAPGTYHWVAEYSGNLPNNNATNHNTTCNQTAEDVVVNTVPARMTTEQKWYPNDTANISASAGGNLAGTVTFTLYPGAGCTGTPLIPATNVAVAGASPQSVSTNNTTVFVSSSTTVYWKVAYDSTNPAQDDIPASCHENTALTITNGGTVPAP